MFDGAGTEKRPSFPSLGIKILGNRLPQSVVHGIPESRRTRHVAPLMMIPISTTVSIVLSRYFFDDPKSVSAGLAANVVNP
jgi:hypothetical protein